MEQDVNIYMDLNEEANDKFPRKKYRQREDKEKKLVNIINNLSISIFMIINIIMKYCIIGQTLWVKKIIYERIEFFD